MATDAVLGAGCKTGVPLDDNVVKSSRLGGYEVHALTDANAKKRGVLIGRESPSGRTVPISVLAAEHAAVPGQPRQSHA